MAPTLAVLVAAAGILASPHVVSPVRSETASSGALRATVRYVLLPTNVYYVRLAVSRSGKRIYDQRVRSLSRPGAWNQPIGEWRRSGDRNAQTITLRDLDGDGEPEILLDFWFGGAHCCYWTRIYRWSPEAQTYTNTAHFWGNFGYRLTNLSGSGRVQLVSADNRFAYAFASFAGSGAPVQAWDYRSGRLVDTTRSYRALISRDVARWWKVYARARHSGEVRGLLAPWAADRCLLGHGTAALAWLERHGSVLAGQYDEQTGSVARYLKRLRMFLYRTGYLP